MTREPLGDDELELALAALPAWQLDGERLRVSRSLTFGDFSEAWAFMTRVALLAERTDHHPDWSNSWNRVEISLTTHDAGGVTQADVDLARRIDDLFTAS